MLSVLAGTGFWSSLAATLGLAALSFAGFYLNLPLFNSVSFVFGSIAALIALRIFGVLPALFVVLVGSTYTYFAWGHPFAMLSFGVEVIFVWLLSRRVENLALADVAYWLFVGMPLVLLTYTGQLGMSSGSAAFIALKQGVNGVLNAVLAGLLLAMLTIAVPALRHRLPKIEVRSLVLYMMAFVAIASCASLITVESRTDYNRKADGMTSLMSTVGLVTQVALRQGIPPDQLGAIYEKQLSDLVATVSDGYGAISDFSVATIAPSGAHQDIFGTTKGFSLTGTLGNDVAGNLLWLPNGDMPSLTRDREGVYLMSMQTEGVPGVQSLWVEFNAAPLIDDLEAAGRGYLMLLAVAVATVLMLSTGLIRWMVAPLDRVVRVSEEMTDALVAGRPAPALQQSNIVEYDRMLFAMWRMSGNLARAFREREELARSLEERVRRRTAELQTMSELAKQTTNGVIIADRDGRVTWVNAAFTRITGYSLDEMRGQIPGKILQKVPPPDEIREHMRTSLERRTSFYVELLNHTKLGTPYWIEVHCNPMFDAEGNHTGYIAIENDITERRRTNIALRDSLERLSLAAEVAELGIWTVNTATGRIEWNDQNFRLHGMSPTDDISQDWIRRVHQDDVGKIGAFFKSLREVRPNDQTFEYRLSHPERGERILASVARAVREGDDTLRVTGITRDVTDERQARERLRRAAQHTEAIIDNILDAIIAIDSRGRINSYNRAAEEIFGHRAEQVIGQSVGILMTNDHAARHGNFIRNYLQGGPAKMVGRVTELEAVRRNGERFPIELAVSEIVDGGDRFFIGIIRDITERRKVERMQSEFLATVSHELRTPLTSIRGTLSLLNANVFGPLEEKAQIMVGAALTNAERLGAMVDEVLDLEKLTQGKMEVRMTPQPLAQIVNEAVMLNQSYADKYGVTLVVEDEVPPSVWVNVDPARAIQILTNFISNGVKFSGHGTCVTVRISTSDTHARVSVFDEGPGVPEDKQSLLFKKFAQLDTSDQRKHRGSGLGLAISRELADRMDGQVGLVSENGKGAEFWVEFPLVAESETPETPGVATLAPREGADHV
ncbi:MAG: PAS domain S-box protein [Limimaricola sp.]|uniref:PAS domain S-box protein n=1 Tax=Limimaricola sp. TaxID=2211665 RepID=UPI001E03D6C3|nr:PAS domain S-box protein [Limimaricola sp.]MBI1417461.1 PAS domain S-box protein [Limimaricola sp.]